MTTLEKKNSVLSALGGNDWYADMTLCGKCRPFTEGNVGNRVFNLKSLKEVRFSREVVFLV